MQSGKSETLQSQRNQRVSRLLRDIQSTKDDLQKLIICSKFHSAFCCDWKEANQSFVESIWEAGQMSAGRNRAGEKCQHRGGTMEFAKRNLHPLPFNQSVSDQ